MVERGRVVLVGEHAEVHLEPVLHPDRALALALPEDLADAGLAGEDREDRPGLGRRGHQVHVRDQLAPPADAAGDVGPDHARGRADLGEERMGHREHIPEAPPGVGGAVLLDAGEDLLLAPLPEALEAADPLVAAGLLQLLDAPDAERFVERGGLLRPEVRQAEQLEDPGRELGAELLEEGQAPGPVELGDLLRQGVADVRQLGEAALAHQRVQVAAEPGHPVGAQVVGA